MGILTVKGDKIFLGDRCALYIHRSLDYAAACISQNSSNCLPCLLRHVFHVMQILTLIKKGIWIILNSSIFAIFAEFWVKNSKPFLVCSTLEKNE